MRLIVEPVWSWPWVVIAGAAMLAVVLLTYPRRVRHLSPRWRYSLIALRVITALVLFLATLRPAIQISETDHRRSEVIVLMDSSRSMSTPDMPGGLTRREALLKMLEVHAEPWQRLAEDVDLKLFDFAGTLQAVETPTDKADGDMTAIGKVLNTLREQEQADRLISVILLGDGAQRAVGDDDVSPLLAARQLAEENGVPINAVVFGSSELSTSGLDLAISDLTLDQPVTFERKTVPVRLHARLLGAAGKTVKFRLLMEDRTGKSLGESGPFVELPLSGDAQPFKEYRVTENSVELPLELSFIAEQPGDYKIAAEVIPQEGEVKKTNNRLETLITVRKGGLRVAYFDTLRTEQKFLRHLNETARIQIDTQFVVSGQQGATLVNPELFEPDAYDVYLIGDVPAEVFNGPNGSLLPELANRVRDGAGLAMLGGYQNFGAGGYATTPLAELLPVRMSATEALAPGQRSSAGHLGHPVKMLPTRDGVRHYLMRLAANNEEAWRQLPEMSGANKLTPKSGAVEILAASRQQEPLLLATDTGRGRVVALAVDETWKWYLHGYASEHQRFWQQLILWLARKEFESDQPVWVRVQPRNFAPHATVPIEFGAQDAEGNPIPDATYEVEVIPPEGEPVKVIPQRLPTGGTGEFSQTDQPGDYWVRVQATQNGESLGISAMTRFVVDARDLELDNPAADPGLMSELAAMTGGSVVAPEGFGEFLTTMLEEGIPSEMQRHRRQNLWDTWGMLLVFVTLMSVEWALRKWKGLV